MYYVYQTLRALCATIGALGVVAVVMLPFIGAWFGLAFAHYAFTVAMFASIVGIIGSFVFCDAVMRIEYKRT
jgi:hypothetical protein